MFAVQLLFGLLCACGLVLTFAPRPFVGPHFNWAWRIVGAIAAIVGGLLLIASLSRYY